MTQKGEFPIHVTVELLDDLPGASWFTKLDLRADYLQISLDPRRRVQNGVLDSYWILRLQSDVIWTNWSSKYFFIRYRLYPVACATSLYALVFFDIILVYISTLNLHLQHVEAVMKLLPKHQWDVKLFKCAFTQKKIAYLGHIISSAVWRLTPAKPLLLIPGPLPTM